MELECRVHAMLEENELLQNTVDNLRERTLVLEKQCHEKDLQVVLLFYRDNEVRYECTVFYKVIFWYFHNSLVKNVVQVLKWGCVENLSVDWVWPAADLSVENQGVKLTGTTKSI